MRNIEKMILATTILAVTPALAATKCVKLDTNTSCNYYNMEAGSGPDWRVMCGNVKVTGISSCTNISGTSGQVRERVEPTTSSGEDNYYCWCKMISPAISKWVFSTSFQSSGSCAIYCGNECLEDLLHGGAFQRSLFSNLSD